DTHVGRIARRLGWTKETDPEKVEIDLNRIVPKDAWVFVPHALIHHGRAICTARNPLCESCPLFDLCPKIGVARKIGAPTSAAPRTPPRRLRAKSAIARSAAR